MIQAIVLNQDVKFNTNKDLFSPTEIDKGTLAMLSVVELDNCDKVLDLGCGYGVVGITIGKIIGERKVVMCDVSDVAVSLAKENAIINGLSEMKVVQSDGFHNIEDTDFSLILSNPPYHTDFSVAKNFIEQGFNKLRVGGKMIMVTKRKTWYKNKLTSTFGGVKIHEVNGYFVFVSEKRSLVKQKKIKKEATLSKKLQRKKDKRHQKKSL